MFELRIKNRKVDLPENFNILWTYNANDLSAPSAIKNNFSKQIELDATPTNDRVFNYAWKIESDYDMPFNPHIRNEFKLYNNGMIIESGYIQLNKITQTGNTKKYAVTLFGGIGDFFYTLAYTEEGDKKSLFDLYYGWRESVVFTPNTDWRQDDPQSHAILSPEAENNGFIMDITPSYIVKAWQELTTPSILEAANTNVRNDIIFMPFDTGKPESDFDAKKVLFSSEMYDRLPHSTSSYWKSKWRRVYGNSTSGSTQYYPKAFLNDHWILGEAPREMSQLEVGTLINTQMVPGIRIKKVLEAIQNPVNNGGYTVEYSENILKDPVINDGYSLLDRVEVTSNSSSIKLVQDSKVIQYVKNGTSAYDVGIDPKLNTGEYPINFTQLTNSQSFEYKFEKHIEANQTVELYYMHKEQNWGTNRGNFIFYDKFGECEDVAVITPKYTNSQYDPVVFSGHPIGLAAHFDSDYYIPEANEKPSWFAGTVAYDPGGNWPANKYPWDDYVVSFVKNGNTYKFVMFIDLIKIVDQYQGTCIIPIVNFVTASLNYGGYVPYPRGECDALHSFGANKKFIPQYIYDIITSDDFKNKISNAIHTHYNPTSDPAIIFGNTYFNVVYSYVDRNAGGKGLDEEIALNPNIFNYGGNYLVKDEFDQDYRWSQTFVVYRTLKNVLLHDGMDYVDIPIVVQQTYTSATIDITSTVLTAHGTGPNNMVIDTFEPSQGASLYTYNFVEYYNASYNNWNLQYPNKYSNYTKITMPNNAWDYMSYDVYNWTNKIVLKQFETPTASTIGFKPAFLVSKSSLLNNTASPYDYLISLSKLLNWRFDYDVINKTVKVMTPDEYKYGQITKGLIIDYSKKQEITPYLMSSAFISLKLNSLEDMYAEYLYNLRYNNDYNLLSIKNNYEFNYDNTNILKDNIFSTVPEYQSSSPMFNHNEYFLPLYRLPGYKIYKYESATDTVNMTYENVTKYSNTSDDRVSIPVTNDFPMISLYDKEYNYVSAMNTIVLFNGFINNEKVCYIPDNELPANVATRYCYFGISADNSNLYAMNDGQGCYVNDFKPDSQEYTIAYETNYGVWPTDIPYFTNYKFLNHENIDTYNTGELNSHSALLFTNNNVYYPINPSNNINLYIKTNFNDENKPLPYALWNGHSILDPDANLNYLNYMPWVGSIYDTPALNATLNEATLLNHYNGEILSITDNNARQIKVNARLNIATKEAMKYNWRFTNGIYQIAKIENYDLSKTNPFADITLQRIKNT